MGSLVFFCERLLVKRLLLPALRVERESHTARTDAPLNLPRLALRGGDWQKAAVNEEPPAKRRRLGKLWWWLLAIFLGACGWQMWKLHLYNNAVREAKEAGFTWKCDDAFSLIRQNYDNVWRRETWGEHQRVLWMRKVPDLGRYREMLHHLNPTVLYAERFNDENVDALKDLTGLQTLFIQSCHTLQNVDGLKGLAALQEISLIHCHALQNVDGLKGLTALKTLTLSYCPALQNVDGLKGLTTLQELNLWNCTALQNVDALKSLTGLQTLDLRG